MSTNRTTDPHTSAPGPPASGAAAPPPARPGGGKPVAITMAVIGGVALLATGLSAAAVVTRSDALHSQSATGLAALDINAWAADFSLVYGDVREAELEVTDSRGEWSLDRHGDTLVVERESAFLDFSWLDFDDWFGPDEIVVLTLPEAVRDTELDAGIRVTAGSFDAEGSFDELGVDVSAGSLSVTGSARSLDANMSSGRTDLALDNVTDAVVSISAGHLDADLTGTAPHEVTTTVSAGTLDLTLPRTAYDVRSDVSAGSFDNRLDVSTSAPNRVTVEVSAGSATIRSFG